MLLSVEREKSTSSKGDLRYKPTEMKTGSPYARLGTAAEVPTLAWEQQCLLAICIIVCNNHEVRERWREGEEIYYSYCQSLTFRVLFFFSV